jgi:hypothetical protein
MDIRKALLKEHSKAQCKNIVDYIGNDTTRFAELMKAFFADEYRVTQRAAWPLSYCVQDHPELITPYFARLIEMIKKPGVHNAVVRNIVRLLQEVPIPKKFHGKVMTSCFDLLSAEDAPIAVRAFSLTVLHKLSGQYPEIIPELRLIIKERFDRETPAFKSRARKILQQIG